VNNAQLARPRTLVDHPHKHWRYLDSEPARYVPAHKAWVKEYVRECVICGEVDRYTVVEDVALSPFAKFARRGRPRVQRKPSRVPLTRDETLARLHAHYVSDAHVERRCRCIRKADK